MIDDSPGESQPLSLVLPLVSVPPRGWDTEPGSQGEDLWIILTMTQTHPSL